MRTLVTVACILLCFWGVSAPDAEAQKVGQWGVGVLVDYAKPMLGLADRWGNVPKGGITLTYRTSARISIEVEYHYAKFKDGSLETTPFVWSVDGRSYTSPNAVHEMRLNSFLMNTLIGLGARDEGGFAPYLAVGAGLYAYRTKVENLVYPGQAVEPLDMNLYLPDQADVRTALGMNVGLGGSVRMGEQVALDVRARYNVIFGYLRPRLAWGIAQTSFFQMLDVGAGLKFFF